jgi:hypothetical protein
MNPPSPASERRRRPLYVFHHIPKCGGTASLHAFRKWFRIVYDYRADVSPEATDFFLKNRLDLSALDDDSLVSGHFELPGAHLHQRYPETLARDRFRLITFVRDPLEVAHSLYFYERAMRADYPYDRLAGRLDAMENYMASIFPCTEEDYKSVIDRYFFVGLTECLQESFDILARMIGKERVTVPVENALPRDEALTDDEAARFYERNALDVKLFAYGRERFERERDAYG